MYFEAELKSSKFKVDVTETRTSWKIAIQGGGQGGEDRTTDSSNNQNWIYYEIPKSDYKESENYFSFLFKGVSYMIDVVGRDTEYTVFTRNSFRTVKIYNDEMLLHESLKRGSSMGSGADLRSGMPGKVIEIFVQPGEIVKANRPLLIMEAMKMENEMRSHQEVKIKNICVKQGDNVETGAVLIQFEPLS